jgi:putative restriction endonuclease
MSVERRLWSRDELILAFNLYCKLPFTKINHRNADVIELAGLLGRTPSSVAWKLANYARLDPELAKRNVRGATHGSKAEIEIRREFENDWENLAFLGEKLRAELEGKSLQADITELPPGIDRLANIKTRVNQSFFRSAVLAAYEGSCCITGINDQRLLCASHIVPWAADSSCRTNPRNGLCLNAFHDRAFDRGLITVTKDYCVAVSSTIKATKNPTIQDWLLEFDGSPLRMPRQFMPKLEFLAYHRQHVYQK